MRFFSSFWQNRRNLHYLIAWTLGLILSIPYLAWLIHDTGLSLGWGLLLIFIYSSILLGGISYFLLFKYSLPILNQSPNKWKWFWIIFSFCFGIWLTIAIPVEYPLKPVNLELSIIATGNKDPQSNGSEVWMNRLVTSEGIVPLEDFYAGEGWEVREGLWFSYSSKDALIWQGTSRNNLQLIFVSHPWSGDVEVVWNGKSQVVDLYDPDGKEILLDLVPPLPPKPSLVRQVLFVIGTGFGIGLLILILGAWLLKQLDFSGEEEKRTSSVNFLKYSFASFIGLTLYWLMYFPAIMGSDVVDQWGQMMSFQINDAHPAAHTLYFWVLTRLWNNPAIVALFQIIAFSLVVGKILDFFEQKGAPKFLLWVIAILFCANPLNAINIISLWKDTLFSLFFLIVFYFMLKIVWSKGVWLNSVKNIILFTLTLLGLSLIRHNGILVVIGVVFGLLIFHKKRQRYAVMISFATIIIIRFLITGPVYDFVGVEKSANKYFMNSYVSYYLGNFISERPDLLTEEQKDLLDIIYPIESKWNFDRYCQISIVFNPEIKDEIDMVEYKILLNLIMKYPSTFIDMIFDHGTLVWKIKQMDSYIWLFHEPLSDVYIYPLEWGPELQMSSFFPKAAEFFGNLLSTGKNDNSVNWLLFRPAINLYFSTFIIFFSVFRNQKITFILLYIPIFVQSVTMLILLTCQDFRYQFPIYVVSLIIFPLIFISKTGISKK
jgi:hypothetical protein